MREHEIDQITVLRGMTPGQRWDVAERLYWQARTWKEAVLRSLHPEWTEEKVRRTVKDQFAYGRTS